MGRYSRYDATLDVIETDVTGVHATSSEVIDQIFDELEEIAQSKPGRYVLACWKYAKIEDASIAAHYGERTTHLLAHVRGILRYAATDGLTKVHVRTEAMKHRAEGMRSNLYEDRNEAIKALRKLREK
jgi:hypothetical protein